jgi:hypothetical protein
MRRHTSRDGGTCVSLDLGAPEMQARRLYVNLGCGARQGDDNVFVVIRHPAD